MVVTQFEMSGIAPTPILSLSLGKRLNILTGDNSLGKTLLLDSLFWAFSGEWVALPTYPSRDTQDAPQISLTLSNGIQDSTQNNTQDGVQNPMPLHHQHRFDRTLYDWPPRTVEQSEQLLALYARADGSFAVWDPYKAGLLTATNGKRSTHSTAYKALTRLSHEQVLDGLNQQDEVDGKVRSVCNGLIRDWLTWQYRPDPMLFTSLMQAIATLSPPDAPITGAGQPMRLPNDAREIPTLQLSYGEVALPMTAAGLRRIVSLAYLLLWLWHEHQVVTERTKQKPLQQLVILLDEVEAHLHPKWQRAILPALLQVAQALDSQLQVQFVVVTHAPLVLASLEPLWDVETDRLFHLNLQETGEEKGRVTLKEVPFTLHGDASRWLTSELFELTRAGSFAAEAAIRQATQLQMQPDPSQADVQRIDTELARVLDPLDPFWPLWRYFAKQHEVRA